MPADGQLTGLLCDEGLLAEMDAASGVAEFDESAPARLLHVGHRTGEPKGVLYSDRAMVPHTFFSSPRARPVRLRPQDLAGRSLFHANAWAVPYITSLTSCTLILPGVEMTDRRSSNRWTAKDVRPAGAYRRSARASSTSFKKRGRKPKHLGQILAAARPCRRAMIDTLTRD